MLKNYHVLMLPAEGESSAGGVAVNEEIIENIDPNETFDNMEYESEASKKAGEAFKEKFKERIENGKKARDEVEKLSKEEKKEAPKSKKGSDIDLVKNDDDQMDLDGKETKKEEKKEVKKEEKEEKPEPEEKEEEKIDEKSEAKKLKIRMSDGLYGIESDAKVRVKIDGEFQEVPVQELINNYSGKTAWDKKFTEIGQEKKQLELAKGEIDKTRSFLSETVKDIVNKLEDPNSNPFDALSILVEKSGRDPFELWKRSIEANLDEVEKLMAMSEVERKAYFLEKKDEFRSKADNARKEQYTKEQAFNQALAKVDALRQAQGVSEDQYLNALDELEAQGVDTNKMSDEQVVDYASLKPHVTAVQDILEPYEDSISDASYSKVVQKLARELRAGDYSKEQLKEWARKEFADEDLKDLGMRTKEAQKKTSKVEVKAPEKFETLDDWD